MNCVTDINVKKLDIKNKKLYNKIPYEYLHYTDESLDIKKGDLDMNIDIKLKNKKLIYVINLSNIIYCDNKIYKKIIKGLKNNKEYKYLLIIDNIYVKDSQTYDQDIKNLEQFYSLLPLLNFSLKKMFNKKIFNLENIFNELYFENIKNLYPYNNFQNQILFIRHDEENKVKLIIPKLNNLGCIIKNSIEFIDHLEFYDFYTDFNLTNTVFIINKIISNVDLILKNKIIFPILYVFTYISKNNTNKAILLLLFIKSLKNTIFYENYRNFIESMSLYSNFTVKYAIIEQIYNVINNKTNSKLKSLYEEFISLKCDLCIINNYKFICKCGKHYCSKECQKINWGKKLFNHKINCI